MWDWAGVPYAIVGSVASSVYGEPRSTNDVDLLIQLARADAGKLTNAFSVEDFYVPPPEVIEVELGRTQGGHINIISLKTMMKADFYPLSAWEATWFADRRRIEIAGRGLSFARPEAVIVHKLRFFREGGGDKHLRDIRGMLAVSAGDIDLALLERAVGELGLGDAWRAAQAE